MRAFLYALLTLGILVASVVLLRTFRTPVERPPAGRGPSVWSEAPGPGGLDKKALATSSPAELIDTGDELVGLWHVREAAQAYGRAAAEDSTDARAWLGLVRCYTDPLMGREDAARNAMRRARKLVPAAADTAFFDGVDDLFIEGNYASAVDQLAAAARADSATYDTLYLLAVAAYRDGHLDDAERYLEELLSRDDTVGPALELSVCTMAVSGDLDGAAARAREMAREYNEEPFPYVLLAHVELLRGHLDDATEFCNNALVLDPRYIPAILMRGALYANDLDLEPARVSFEKLLLFEDPVLQSLGEEGIAFTDFLSGDFPEGVDAMDESIRLAMLAGAVRTGLRRATRLVDVLCELGQPERAAEVIDRWITGFGEVPVALARLRVDVARGDLDRADGLLVHIQAGGPWLDWCRRMGIDPTELTAYVRVAEARYGEARKLLGTDAHAAAAEPARDGRREFLRGIAAFESGDAEAASPAFAAVESRLFPLQLPYLGNPVIFVQSLFFRAESALASGDTDSATRYYQAFLDYWDDAAWDLPAVKRAHDRLESLGAPADTTG